MSMAALSPDDDDYNNPFRWSDIPPAPGWDAMDDQPVAFAPRIPTRRRRDANGVPLVDDNGNWIWYHPDDVDHDDVGNATYFHDP